MDTRQLEYFVAVAEELNFTRAAGRLFAVQSTVSAGVKALEQELGALLFDRTNKRVSLTPAGAALLPEARAGIEAVDRMRSAVAMTQQGIRGRLRVGVFTSLEYVGLPELMGEFHQRYPLVDLQLAVSPSGSTGLAEDVRHGRIDVAFMGLPMADLAGFRVLVLAYSSFIALLPVGHPASEGQSVRLADLVADRWVDSPPGYANRVELDRAIASLGLRRAVSTQVVDLGDIAAYVGAGIGIAVIPEITSRPAAGVVPRPLRDVDVQWMLSAISRPNPSPATSVFLELLAERLLPKFNQAPETKASRGR